MSLLTHVKRIDTFITELTFADRLSSSDHIKNVITINHKMSFLSKNLSNQI